MEKILKSIKFPGLDDVYVIPEGGSNIEVDTELSGTSENPVQNKVIKEAIDNLAGQIEDAGSIDIDLTGANEGEATPVNADTLGGRSPEEYIALANDYTNQQVRKAAPRNLLDNSDFRNPVNQRGQANYTNTGYSIDRWRFRSTNGGTLDVSGANSCVRINAGTSGINGLYNQIASIDDVTNILSILGKQVTIAVKVKENNLANNRFNLELINSTSATSAGSNSVDICGKSFEGDGIKVLTATMPESLTNQYLDFIIRCSSDCTGGYLDIEWAALYEGEYTAETLPEYQPKGYGAELAECQRYYYQSWNAADWDGKTVLSSGVHGFLIREAFSVTRLFGVEMPVEMRVPRPTITVYTPRGVVNAVSDYNTGNTIITGVGEAYFNNKNFIPAAPGTGDSKFTVGTVYAFHYSASADL